ncbi:ABC transporter substrate-binding protein [Entomohabitans teleogrylli]|uniref:ABC transporter substrate-binding protein n=1 Tax=Entomohabitans teleogrylli TaxID=1384589 RepID=UPI00073D583C|nr:ABC transporter substrate-binding protein [Entomohabitans teleogrylli]
MKRNGLLAVIGLLVALQASGSGFPVTVESCGRPLTFEQAPQRAVIHDLNMAEMAFALALQPQMAGLTGISGWYKATPAFNRARGAIPELAPKYPSLETLLAARADFFFAGWNYGMKVGGEVTPQTLANYHIPTLVLSESCIHVAQPRPRATMALLYNDIATLGKIFGKAELADALIAAWMSRLEGLKNRIGDRAPVRVFVYDSGKDKPFTSGKYAMPTALIEAAGARNVMDSLPVSWATTSWETVASAGPEFIILLDYQNNGAGSADELQRFLESHPLMKQTPAVIGQRYLRLKYQELTPGPANITAIENLAHALYPDAFAQ